MTVPESTVDRWKYYDVIHADQAFWNPLSEAKVAEIIDLLRLPAGARMLDIASGRGEFLLRTVERWGGSGIGVDASPRCIDGAREAAARRGIADTVEFVQSDGAAFEARAESFDAVSCIGASWIWGGYRGTLEALTRWTKPGGLILSGEPFWKREPSPEHLEATGYGHDLFGTHHGNVLAGEEAGLRFLHTIVSNEDDWDHYEGLHCYSADRYAREHPEDPEATAIVERSRREFDHYLRWGREELGWAVYMFRKPL
ncbi:MAG: class I SAM-dependent methyltransferase [Dehalococcoidia bacterium]|nr:class I SAM-dependent methyltransferase [Dehalococcoidia bacterium]MCB9486690.1 class I SAM-dependent methyltransferase [Thermoflexaceae bacterium]